MLKIKISFYTLLISSLFMFACNLTAANVSDNNQRQPDESKGLTANESNADTAAQKNAGETRFKGYIETARFEMTLRRAGNELSGSYFYAKSGSANALALRGKIDAGGNFTMQEADSSGKQTGEFKGVWKADPNEAGASLEGEWKQPNAKAK